MLKYSLHYLYFAIWEIKTLKGKSHY
jgi:hypothetical protein